MVISKVRCKSDNCKRYANLNSDGICPKCVSAGIDLPTEIISTCKICNNSINDEISKSIGCAGCCEWFHADCEGPSALIDLITQAENQELVGMLLWFCPSCSTGPTKTFSIGDSKCAKFPPPNPKKTMQETSYGVICEKYSKNVCPFGISGKGCNDYHPKMCRPYIKYGPHGKRGCNKAKCDYFHPKLCNQSLKPISQRFCTNHSCPYFHLPRTKRNLPDQHHRHDKLRGQDRNHKSYRHHANYGHLVNERNQTRAAPVWQDPFLGSMIRDMIKESIQAEFATMQNLAPMSNPQALHQKAPPFLPGMSHFSQPWNQSASIAIGSQQPSGPPLTQNLTQWTQ